MSFAGDRRLLYRYLVLFLVVLPVMQIWVCHDCKVEALRSFPGNDMAKKVVAGEKKSKEEDDVFDKFFGGKDLNFSSNGNGFEESKRKVPSCPDPLHN
ncbi:hypothetical protein FNV43_RR26603 [Rhamnella rubrinervis]|uniref:Uncharacterized protein n=1 Tax=Rhamnella rubrinervis TaxID=2594499 RepID=A0A8K0DIV5_9ROSA|nr:hypothetical protein FNV43_RR26603 [Rhamnella rubrinervis]